MYSDKRKDQMYQTDGISPWQVSKGIDVKSQLRAPYFFVMLTGSITCGIFPTYIDNLYCRYVISYGDDWTIVHGIDNGVSQIARKHDFRADRGIIWNFPIEISFKSTNAFGWPRIAVAVYGLDGLGRDVVRGYGSILVPTSPGRYEENVIDMYSPISGSICQRFVNWIAGTLPEFYNTKFTTESEGRAVTRVKDTGKVKLSLEVTTKDMQNFGYSTSGYRNQ